MRGALAEIALAGEFLTRLPLGGMRAYCPERMARAPHWFALVGLALGGAGALVLAGLAQILPMLVAVVVVLTVLVIVTGALHEDGLADTLDGLGGGRSPERALEIMRDSRIGSYGTLTLGAAAGLQGTALVSQPLAQAMGGLILAHTLSRALMTLALTRDPYLRTQGTGSGLTAPLGRAGSIRIGVAVGAAVLIAGTLMPLGAVLTASSLGLLAAALWRAWVLRRLSGQTGDTLGGIQVVTATAILLGASAWT
ncbi:MAG: adenosylcobinamide-GDP ribazoletransferase [Roseinatronobacter sp.]